MTANRKTGNALLAHVALLALLGLLGACSEKQVAPPPRPTPTRTYAPLPPPPPPAQRLNWRDAPVTPGNWQWSMDRGQSTARFGNGEFEMRCDRAAGAVTLLRRGEAHAPVPVTILTSTATRPLTGAPEAHGVAVRLPARDSLLDAMAFSRGRFAVEVAGLPTLYVPSWVEVSRVVEDCR